MFGSLNRCVVYCTSYKLDGVRVIQDLGDSSGTEIYIEVWILCQLIWYSGFR